MTRHITGSTTTPIKETIFGCCKRRLKVISLRTSFYILEIRYKIKEGRRSIH
jgi:hypothetical protein